MEQHHKLVLIQNRIALISKLNCSTQFLEHMMHEQILLTEHVHIILSGRTPEEKNRIFLGFIPRRGPRAYRIMLAACMATNQSEVIYILNQEQC